jgi:hypothetical protein
MSGAYVWQPPNPASQEELSPTQSGVPDSSGIVVVADVVGSGSGSGTVVAGVGATLTYKSKL